MENKNINKQILISVLSLVMIIIADILLIYPLGIQILGNFYLTNIKSLIHVCLIISMIIIEYIILTLFIYRYNNDKKCNDCEHIEEIHDIGSHCHKCQRNYIYKMKDNFKFKKLK